jgi:hypothetical protein
MLRLLNAIRFYYSRAGLRIRLLVIEANFRVSVLSRERSSNLQPDARDPTEIFQYDCEAAHLESTEECGQSVLLAGARFRAGTMQVPVAMKAIVAGHKHCGLNSGRGVINARENGGK